MITDNDVKKLANVFATKNDLVAMEARQDKKCATKDDLKDMKDMLLDDIDGKLKKQKEEIVEAVGEYITDTVVPMFAVQ